MNISHLLTLILTLLIGNSNKNDILSKKPTKEDYLRNLNCWIQRNFYIIALAAIILLLGIFIYVCFLIVGVSATDSGATYNHLHNII